MNMQTNYPWDGKVSIALSPEKPINFSLYIRIPGWTQNNIVDGNLYFVKNEIKQSPEFYINQKNKKEKCCDDVAKEFYLEHLKKSFMQCSKVVLIGKVVW